MREDGPFVPLYFGAMAVGSSQGGTHSYPQTSHFHVHPSCQGVPLGDVRTFSSPVGAMLRLVHFGQYCGGLRISLMGRVVLAGNAGLMCG